jgi:hypothetical protein
MLATLLLTALVGFGHADSRSISSFQDAPATALQNDPDAATIEANRLARLAEIATALQDPESDAVALATEAVRLAGFVIWDEDRKPLAEPLGLPRANLAITDVELREYTTMFREGHTVMRDDLIGAVDVLYHSLGAEGSTAPFVFDWLRTGTNTSNPSARALMMFLRFLGDARAGAAGRFEGEADIALDPLQALLILRVVTEDIGTPLRRAIARGEIGPTVGGADKEETPRGPFLEPEFADAPGWAEDAYVSGYTGLFGEVVQGIGKWGKGVSDGIGKANALASIAKFIATYAFLRGEVLVEGRGQPLVRTKDSDAGEQRTLVARFWIDGSRVTDWMKDHRQVVAIAGLDLDMPKSGALKNVLTEWDIHQSQHSSKYHLIQTVRGEGDISKVKTDEQGEARIHVEGCPQPVALDPKKVMPLDKFVDMVVSPQVKSTEMQQDLVDAVTGAIGIKGGPAGFITPVIETLYRLKWKGGRKFRLQVRDWQSGVSIGQAEITLRASGSRFSRNSSNQMHLDRTQVYRDVEMQVMGLEQPPPLDPNLAKLLPANVRQQMEEGYKQMAELAKKRSFLSQGPGTAELHIHDSMHGVGEENECSDASMSVTKTVDADAILEWNSDEAVMSGLQFTIEVDLEKRTATLNLQMQANATTKTTTTVRGKKKTSESTDHMTIFSGVTIDPPYDKAIVIPLKETEVRDMEISNYYGSLPVPFHFGPGGSYRGAAIVSYSVTRKLAPK